MSPWILNLCGTLLVLCAGVEGVLRNEDLRDPEIKKWLARSEIWVQQLTDKELEEVACHLTGVYIQFRQFMSAMRILSGVKNPTRKSEATICVCGSLVFAGEVAQAIRLANTLDDKVVEQGDLGPRVGFRTRALRYICVCQRIMHDFDGALTTANLIPGKVTRADAMLQVAEYQAKAGDYDGAERTLQTARELWEGDPDPVLKTERLIAECRRVGRRDPPSDRPGPYLDQLRGVLLAFKEDGEDTARAKTEPNDPQKEQKPPSLERAWECFKRGNLEAAHTEADRFLRHVDSGQAKFPFYLAMDYVLVADLYLELGDLDVAQKLVAKAYAEISQGLELDTGLAQFTILPLAVSVYTRSGSPDKAVQLIEKSERASRHKDWDGPLTQEAWFSLGVSCAFVERIDVVEGLLRENRSAQQKVFLCLGVAYGLREKRQKTVPISNRISSSARTEAR